MIGTTMRFRPLRRLLPTALAVAAALLSGCSSGPKGGNAPEITSYSFWPPAPNEPRVQFLRTLSLSSDVEEKRGAFDELVFGSDVQVLPIGKPYGIDCWRGRLYVCDITNPGVVIFDLAQRETRIMNTRGPDRMAQPTDIAIAPDGMKYVSDRKLNRIFVFDAADRYIASYGGGMDIGPAGIALRGDEILVTDANSKRVVVLDRNTGERRGEIGAEGGLDGQFVFPLGIEVDRQGAAYVTDVISGRLQKFGADGGFLWRKGEVSAGAGDFVRAKHLAIDDEGIIYVVDAAFQNVQMFNADGELLMYFGSPGSHPGSMSLPAGIAIMPYDAKLFGAYVHPAFAPERVIVVTNQLGPGKVSLYALGRLKPGRTLEDIAPYRAETDTGLVEEGDVIPPAVTTPIAPEPGTTPPANPGGTPPGGSR